MTHRHLRIALSVGVAFLLLDPVSSNAQESSSTSFVLSQSTVNSGGGSSTSASFVLDGSIAQAAPVGEATSSTYVLQAGFWTSLSTRVVLRVEGAGSGAGSMIGDGIACGFDGSLPTGTCSSSFVRGSILDLVATPDAGNRFDGWTGCDSTSTTTLAGDTCRARLRRETTLTAAFTALATVGDRVWRDIDGDGMQDAGEPGLDGVRVSIDDGNGVSGSVVTDGDGSFGFLDVPPGAYTLEVDPSTLPAGTTPSFDADGIVTPSSAAITLTDGEDRDTADFGYQPQTNLAVSIVDSQDPLPGGEALIYTITVQNLGPGIATGIEVGTSPPIGTTLVATEGCAEDPSAVPVCTLPDLDIGEIASYDLEISIDPAPPASITGIASVSSIEVDLDGSDNTASTDTALDDDPPAAILITADPPTADGELTECETVNATVIERLRVGFDEAMFDPAGDSTPGDVTRPEAWWLIAAGDDGQIDTATCGTLMGDDRAIEIDSVTYEAATRTATLHVAGNGLDPALFRLFACGTGGNALRDLGGTALDGEGDGAAGGDFVRQFRSDPENLFANGALDCGLDSWQLDSDEPEEIAPSADDVDGSDDSGSAAITSLAGATPNFLRQCVHLDATLEYRAAVRLRLETESTSTRLQLRCTHFDAVDCAGNELDPTFLQTTVLDTAGTWIDHARTFQPPVDTVSAFCGFVVDDGADQTIDARLDDLSLTREVALFVDGFETGDTSSWSFVNP